MSEYTDKFHSMSINHALRWNSSFISLLIGEQEKWPESLANAVKNLHDGVGRQNAELHPLPNNNIPPILIFITATSAVPYGQAIKECWNVAWPHEKQPIFDLIDVSFKRFGDVQHSKLSDTQRQDLDKKEIEKLRQEGQRYGAFTKAAVFDEYSNSNNTLKRADELLRRAGFKDVTYCAGQWGLLSPYDRERAIVRNENQALPFRNLVIQKGQGPQELLMDMKKIGRLMAQEILKH